MSCKFEVKIDEHVKEVFGVANYHCKAVVVQLKGGKGNPFVVFIGCNEVFFMDQKDGFSYSEIEYFEKSYEILSIPAELNIKINKD